MSNLTKREIVLEIYRKTGFPQKQIVDTVQQTLDIVQRALANGRNVELRNFGVLEVQVRMVAAGIQQPSLEALGVHLHCFIDDPEVRQRAKAEGPTRSWCAMEKAIAAKADVDVMPKSWLVSQRGKGGKCPRCGHELKSSKIRDRTAWFCPHCQRRAL